MPFTNKYSKLCNQRDSINTLLSLLTYWDKIYISLKSFTNSVYLEMNNQKEKHLSHYKIIGKCKDRDKHKCKVNWI